MNLQQQSGKGVLRIDRWAREKMVAFAAVCLISVLLTATAGAQSSPEHPTQLHGERQNSRHLFSGNKIPFLVQGDTARSLIVGLNDAEVEQYLKNRHDKGFNTIFVNLIEHKYSKKPPLNEAGDAPFLKPDDFSTFNEKYFAHADWVIRKAAEYGIQVFLSPCYLGNGETGDGWLEELMKQDAWNVLKYSRFLGTRYRTFDNVVFVFGGDRNPHTAKEKEMVDLLALGILEVHSENLFTAQAEQESSAIEAFGDMWLDFNSTYSRGMVHQKLLADYNRVPIWPFFLIESTYEGEHNASAVQIRRQAYWAVLCGGIGHIMGNGIVWSFKPGWQTAMDQDSSVDMMHWGQLFRSRNWSELVPDQKHEVVTRGVGEFNGLDYLAAARTSDGSTVIAYMPTRRMVTVDMSKVSGGQAKAWWFNPHEGKATVAGVFPTSGMHEFIPPTDSDWVLVLDDASIQLPAPGTEK